MYTILNIIDFYKKDKNCIIQKILLSSNKSGIKWYNDITIFTKKPLIYLILKMREDWTDNSHNDSHINFSETNNKFTLEITTINPDNTHPILLDITKFKENLVLETLNDL